MTSYYWCKIIRAKMRCCCWDWFCILQTFFESLSKTAYWSLLLILFYWFQKIYCVESIFFFLFTWYSLQNLFAFLISFCCIRRPLYNGTLNFVVTNLRFSDFSFQMFFLFELIKWKFCLKLFDLFFWFFISWADFSVYQLNVIIRP
mgnify:CR=1 FL=1